MARPLALRGRWILVTGASAGLGREMARELAAGHGANLVLLARREERLVALAEELRAAHGVEAIPLVGDLSRPETCDALFAKACEGRVLAGAVLNAGVTHYGDALALSATELSALVHTNVTSLASLALCAARHLKLQPEGGGLMLVSSVGGFMPVPFQAAYSGTKAFVTHFGLSLGVELEGSGVSVTVFAPGGMPTELIETSGLGRKFKSDQLGMMPVAVAARLAVKGFVAREALVVPGVLNQALAFVTRLVPRRFMAARAGDIYRPPPPG